MLAPQYRRTPDTVCQRGPLGIQDENRPGCQHARDFGHRSGTTAPISEGRIDLGKEWVAETTDGVAPVGHPAPLRGTVDTDLAQFDEVWAAGGLPHYVFPTSFDELLRMTGGTPVDVGT